MAAPQPTDIDQDDKPLSYSQRFKKECSSAASLCFWDRLVESFKVKGKKGGQDQPPPPKSYSGDNAELQQQRESYETQLENQREHFLSQLQEKDELLAQQQQDFESKLLQVQQDSEQTKKRSETMVEGLRQELLQSKEKSMEIQNVSELVQQYEFVVPNFSKLKKEKMGFTSPPMYSKPGGYKFIFEIASAGTKTGAGSDVSVRVFSKIGEYDANLSFPVKMNITMQLLNQEDKREGHEKFLSCVYKASVNGDFLGSDPKFIGLAEIQRNAGIYLKNDQLWFRITEIDIVAVK